MIDFGGIVIAVAMVLSAARPLGQEINFSRHARSQTVRWAIHDMPPPVDDLDALVAAADAALAARRH